MQTDVCRCFDHATDTDTHHYFTRTMVMQDRGGDAAQESLHVCFSAQKSAILDTVEGETQVTPPFGHFFEKAEGRRVR